MIAVAATGLFWICTTLFGLKLLWNLYLPYSLARDPLPPGQGISLMPYLEGGLLIVGLVLAVVRGEPIVGASVWQLALIGAVAVAATYLHLVVVATVVGWLTRSRSRD